MEKKKLPLKDKYPDSYYQPLFDLMREQHGLVLLSSEMSDIIEMVRKLERIDKQPGAVWVKASSPDIKDGEYVARFKPFKEVMPYDPVGMAFVSGDYIHFICPSLYDIKWRKGHEELQYLRLLDESGAAAPPLPAFWDVAKAFKWAAEYSNEKGEQLVLSDGQWRLINDDGDEAETEDLTPGNVAELYCLQNGFTKEVEESAAAGRDELSIDELWDEYSEMIDDDIDSLSRWAGSTVVDKEQFRKAVAKMWEVLNYQQNRNNANS